MKTKLVIAAGLLVLLAGCNNTARWQYAGYEPYLGDPMAPRADWAAGEKQNETDWNRSMKKMGVNPDGTIAKEPDVWDTVTP